MARDEAGPFARGETYYNGSAIDTTNLGGVNLEGKEFVFEVNAPDDPTKADPSGRLVRVRVVRNVCAANLKPARIAHFTEATTATSPLECQVDGYCIAAADRPAGVIDEFLPAAGVPTNDLFYLVIDGPTVVTQASTSGPTSFVIGNRLVPYVSGATAGDDLGGRVAPQVLTGATAILAQQIQNHVGFAASSNATSNATFAAVAHVNRW